MPNLYSSIVSQLQGHFGKGEAQALARIIIEDLLHLPLPRVMAGLVPSLSAEEGQIVDRAVQRLLADEPIQHIVGRTLFHGLPIIVNPSVLIPRPETEQLVDIALSLPVADEEAVAMDACTGSGCIAIALKTERPQWHVYGCDISTEALQTARENAMLNDADVTFTHCDLTSADGKSAAQPSGASETRLPSGPFNLIVSNPPYVMNKENSSMEPRVLEREPHLALFVPDDDPLIFYRAIAMWGRRSLIPSGWIAVEINPLLSAETRSLFAEHGYANCEIRKDIFGKERFLICQR